MKKLIYILTACLFMGGAFADYDFSKAIKTTSMPSDAEIRAIIKEFNFNEEQSEDVFKDVKRRLQEMYSNQNMQKTNQELNSYMNALESEGVNTFTDNGTKRELLRSVSGLKTNSQTQSQPSTQAPSVKSESSRKYGPREDRYNSKTLLK